MPMASLRLAAAAWAVGVLALGAVALDANCTCSDFCAGNCSATNAGKPEQLTMYRLTPGNVTGVADKDTGGNAGDLGFVFQRLSQLARCTEAEANTNGCFLAYRPVIRQFYVDVDGKYGPYVSLNARAAASLPYALTVVLTTRACPCLQMRCNPMPFVENPHDSNLVDTTRWGCYPWHGHGATPWDPATGHGSTSCADGAYCGALMNASVGRDPAMHHAYNPEHPNIAAYFSGEWLDSTPLA